MFREHKGKVAFIALALIIIALVIVSYVLKQNLNISSEALRDWIIAKGMWGPLIFLLLYVLTSVLIFPGSVLSIASGMVWGPILGTILTVCAATLASSIPFLLARYLGRNYINHATRGSKIEACDRFISQRGFLSIVIVRLIPIFPWDVINYGAGLCGFRFRQYITATFIGIIPGSLVYTMIGDALGKPLQPSKIIFISLMIVIILLLSWIYQRHRESTDAKHVQK